MVQFFGQRPVFIQNLTDAIGRGVQAGAVENQQALQQAIMFGQGLGQLGQGLVGTPQFRAEQRQNERQDELLARQQQAKEDAFDLESSMKLGVPIDAVRKFRTGEMTVEELTEAGKATRTMIREEEREAMLKELGAKAAARRKSMLDDLQAQALGISGLLIDAGVPEEEAFRQGSLAAAGIVDQVEKDRPRVSIEEAIERFGEDAPEFLEVQDAIIEGDITESEGAKLLRKLGVTDIEREKLELRQKQFAQIQAVREDNRDIAKDRLELSRKAQDISKEAREAAASKGDEKERRSRFSTMAGRLQTVINSQRRMLQNLQAKREERAVYASINPELLADIDEQIAQLRTEIAENELEKAEYEKQALPPGGEDAGPSSLEEEAAKEGIGGG